MSNNAFARWEAVEANGRAEASMGALDYPRYMPMTMMQDTGHAVFTTPPRVHARMNAMPREAFATQPKAPISPDYTMILATAAAVALIMMSRR